MIGPYELNKIYTGDAMILSDDIPDDFIDLVFTDPPWGIDFKYSNRYNDDVDSYLEIVKWIVQCCNRVLKPGAFAFVYQATKRLMETWQLFPRDSRLFATCKNFVQIKSIPIEYAVDFIVFWQKPGEFQARGMFRDWNIAKTHNTTKGSRELGLGVKISPPRPLDSVYNIVSQMCPPGGTVVDFFIGSGTTAVAAKMCNLNYLGFEIHPETAEFARQRIANTQPRLLLPRLDFEQQTFI